MKRKTKTAWILIGIGVLIFAIGLLIMWFTRIQFGSNESLIIVMILTIGGVLIAIGGRMLKIRFNRWMEED